MTWHFDLSTDDFSAEPWTYPGEEAPVSGLLQDGKWLEMTPQDGRRLGQTCVRVSDDEVQDRLNYVLLRSNVAPPDSRYLVAAVGSNASPAVLRRKFSRAGVNTTVPLLKGTIRGIGIGHSAHVSAPGYIPNSPYSHASAESSVTVALLDGEQLECLDASEPNYRRLHLTASGLPLTLDGGEQPGDYYLYESRWGVIAPPDGPAIGSMTQEEVFNLLRLHCARVADVLPRAVDLSTTMGVLAGDPALRDQVRSALAEADWARPSGLIATADSGSALNIPYGRSPSAWAGRSPAPGSLTCLPTPDHISRSGEQTVVLHSEEATSRGLGQHAALGVLGPPELPPVLARVIRDDRIAKGSVGVDQVLRNALGVELQEQVSLRPARAPQTPVADIVLAKPHFSAMRVQTADLATVEQSVALTSPLAMAILGIQSGDEIVIQGSPDDAGTLPQVRLTAIAAPEETVQRRETLSGGGLTARFPSARHALGVYPDLPWVFLDSATRERLHVASSKLSTVRVRASRRFQLYREVRELLLVLVLAFLGLASVVTSRLVLIAVLFVVLVAAVTVTRHRLKQRLETER